MTYKFKNVVFEDSFNSFKRVSPLRHERNFHFGSRISQGNVGTREHIKILVFNIYVTEI